MAVGLFRAAVAARPGRDQGFGAGINEWQVAQWLAEHGDFDLFLLAGRYTLLEQEALESFLPLCEKRGIGIVLGGPYNSGILATGPKPGAYVQLFGGAAGDPRQGRAHRGGLPAARRQAGRGGAAVPAAASRVVSVIPGGQRPEEVRRNAETLKVKIPAALWADFKTEGLLRKDAPTPA